MTLNEKIDPPTKLKASDWELDFYSRPIIEAMVKRDGS